MYYNFQISLLAFGSQMAGLPTSPVIGTSLLFIKTDEILQSSNTNSPFPNGLDIIYAIEEVSGKGSIEGAQRIGKLYRIYIKTEQARDKLATEGFTFCDRHVSFYTKNPFTVREQSDTVKILIGGVPLSVANSEFEKALLDLNVNMVSELKFENYRDKDGKWTSYKTGRRFVYCEKPALNLKPTIKIGLWSGSLFYREQVRPKSYNHSTGGEQFGNRSANNDTSGNCLESAETGTITQKATVGIDETDLLGKSTVSSTQGDVTTQGNGIDTPNDDAGKFTVATTQFGVSSQVVGNDTPIDYTNDCSKDHGSVLVESPLASHRSKKDSFKGSQHKLTHSVRRSRSHSLNTSKRKEMVSSKSHPPPPKAVKNIPTSANSLDLSKQRLTDWFNCKNDYS